MLATIASAALQGIDAEIVHVEVNAGEAGEPKLMLFGLVSPNQRFPSVTLAREMRLLTALRRLSRGWE